MTESLKSLFNQLHSTSFQARSRAIEAIMTTRDPYILRDIGHQVQEYPNDDSLIIVIGMCEEILKEDDTTISHHALYILNSIIHNSPKILANKAKKTLLNYFKTTEIINGHKALLIIKAWAHIAHHERFFLIDIIKSFKYHSLVNLLLDNFSTKNEELIIKSIYALNDLNESRGNRFLRDLLSHPHKDIQKATLYALGNTGIYFDVFKIKSFLQHPDLDLRQAAVIALRKLYKHKALSLFKNNFKKQPLLIQKTILEEVTTLNSPKALSFLLELLDATDMGHLSTVIEWSIYNLQTKKKIGTIIKFFPQSSPHTRYRLLNLLGDFDDDKCRRHFITVANSQENIMVRSLSLHHLSHYDDKLTVTELNDMLEKTDERILRYSIIKSLLNMSQDIAKQTIDSLLVQHKDLSDEVIMLIIKNFKNSTRLFESDLYSMFIFEALQEGSLDVQLAVLNLLPQHHNAHLFHYLTELYHDEDEQLLKDHIALCQLHILINFPYYLSAQGVNEEMEYLIQMINPYKANYQLILHLILLDTLTQSPALEHYMQENKKAITYRLNYILNKNQLTVEDINMILNYLFDKKMMIQDENYQFIIDYHFDNFNPEKKELFLKQLMNTNNDKYYNFIVDNYYRYQKQIENLQFQFQEYMENIL